MSHESWNYPQFDENLVSPQIQQNVALIHGKTDVVSERVAEDNKHPLYPWDRNSQEQMRNTGIRDRDIVYVFKDQSHPFDDIQRQDITGEQSLPVMSSLLGQGEENHKEEFKSSIIPIGFCNNGNKHNDTDRINIQIGGTLTVRNNGPNTIYASNYVIADLPDINAPYINGENRKELILKPYDPTIHKNTSNSIRLCLDNAKNTDSSYNQSYINYCDQMFSSLLDMFLLNMIGISTGMLFGDNNPDPDSEPDALNKDINKLIESMKELHNGDGDSEHKMRQIMSKIKDFKQELLNNYENSMKRYFFPKVDENLNTENEFHKLHHGLMGNFLISQANLLNETINWTMGKATTTAAPGKDFTILIGRHGI